MVSDALLSCATAMETGAAEVNPVDALVDSLMSTVPAMLAVFSEVAGPVASFAQFRSFSTSFFLVNSGRSCYRIREGVAAIYHRPLGGWRREHVWNLTRSG